jgi:hypothetical protein
MREIRSFNAKTDAQSPSCMNVDQCNWTKLAYVCVYITLIVVIFLALRSVLEWSL